MTRAHSLGLKYDTEAPDKFTAAERGTVEVARLCAWSLLVMAFRAQVWHPCPSRRDHLRCIVDRPVIDAHHLDFVGAVGLVDGIGDEGEATLEIAGPVSGGNKYA